MLAKLAEGAPGRAARPREPRQSRQLPERVLYADHLSVGVLLWWLLRARRVSAVWLFRDPGPFVSTLVGVLRGLSWLRCYPRRVPYGMDVVRDEAGTPRYYSAVELARDLALEIVETRYTGHPFMKALGAFWPVMHVRLHLERELHEELRTECMRVHLVAWAHRRAARLEGSVPVLMLQAKPWHRHLRALAAEEGVLLAHTRWARNDAVRAHVAVLPRRLGALAQALRPRLARPKGPVTAAPTSAPAPAGCIAVHAFYRSLSVDPAKRSELFWASPGDVPLSRILLYGVDPLAKAEDVEGLRRLGVTVLGAHPSAGRWRPRGRAARLAARLAARVLAAALLAAAMGRPPAGADVARILRLAVHYAYWTDFFEAHRVRVQVGTMNVSVAQVMALRDLGGVSVSYQYSLSALPFGFEFPAGEDVWFVFSDHYEGIWRSLGPEARAYVKTGYVYDGDVRRLAKAPPSAVREELQRAGAQYVLCFFDQNSMDRWDHIARHAIARTDYEFLLQWLREDPTLGVVFKPKFFRTLPQRLGPELWARLEEAERTGRCILLRTTQHMSETFPAEAALNADVCVGKLRSGTAALEGAMAGVPSLLVDGEGYPYEDVFGGAEGRVVFRDWPSLQAAVAQHRAGRGVAGFGDWATVLHKIDPYGDGEAPARMGRFLGWLLEGLEKGLSPKAAIQEAVRLFEQRWPARSLPAEPAEETAPRPATAAYGPGA